MRNIIIYAAVAAVAFGVIAAILSMPEGVLMEGGDPRLAVILDNGHTPLGSPDAPITLVEFGDFQCHFCNVFFHNTEEDIMRNYVDTGQVRMIFKDYTIIGPDSITAAQGGWCAQEQGLFWEYHDIVYSNWAGENNGWASLGNLRSFAQQAGLNAEAWYQCTISASHTAEITASNSDARTLDIGGTPSFFVVGPDGSVTEMFGAQPYGQFERVFEDILGG